jgi:hypothetical protein
MERAVDSFYDPKSGAPGIALHARVSVPDGNVGKVIGFYNRDPETVLVLFDSGGSHEFAPADLHRVT